MGEPAVMSAAERAHVRDIARRVRAAIVGDEMLPRPTWPDGYAMSSDEVISQLSLLLVATDEALGRVCDLADEGFSRGWDSLDRRDRMAAIQRLRDVDLEAP